MQATCQPSVESNRQSNSPRPDAGPLTITALGSGFVVVTRSITSAIEMWSCATPLLCSMAWPAQPVCLSIAVDTFAQSNRLFAHDPGDDDGRRPWDGWYHNGGKSAGQP